MEAGRLRHRITILAPSVAQDAYGEPTGDWTTYTSAWASKADLEGRELYLAQQTVPDANTRFRIRYLPGITPLMRIALGTDSYDILSAGDPTGEGRELVILAKKLP